MCCNKLLNVYYNSKTSHTWYKVIHRFNVIHRLSKETDMRTKKKKKKKNKPKTNIKYNNPLKSIVARRLAEQHVIQKQQQVQKNHLVSGSQPWLLGLQILLSECYLNLFFVKYDLNHKNYS